MNIALATWGAISGFLLLALSVPAGQAESNLTTWLDLLGLPKLARSMALWSANHQLFGIVLGNLISAVVAFAVANAASAYLRRR